MCPRAIKKGLEKDDRLKLKKCKKRKKQAPAGVNFAAPTYLSFSLLRFSHQLSTFLLFLSPPSLIITYYNFHLFFIPFSTAYVIFISPPPRRRVIAHVSACTVLVSSLFKSYCANSFSPLLSIPTSFSLKNLTPAFCFTYHAISLILFHFILFHFSHLSVIRLLFSSSPPPPFFLKFLTFFQLFFQPQFSTLSHPYTLRLTTFSIFSKLSTTCPLLSTSTSFCSFFPEFIAFHLLPTILSITIFHSFSSVHTSPLQPFPSSPNCSLLVRFFQLQLPAALSFRSASPIFSEL